MTRFLLIALVVAALPGLATGQIWVDAFSYPAGPNLGNWTRDLGNWTATGARARADNARSYQYITQKTLTFQDCTAECFIEYDPQNRTSQQGGPSIRCNDPTNLPLGKDLLLIKVQDNNSSGDFDSIWLYEHQPGGLTPRSSRTSITPTFTKATARILAIDNRVVGQVDTDGDGKWNYVLNLTQAMPVKSGPIGAVGLGGNFIDDFKLFDGVILDDPTGPRPAPGATVKFMLRGFPAAPYQAATSLSNSGIRLADGRIVPLGLDDVTFVSAGNLLPGLFQNYRGSMTSTGDATISIALPPLSALRGLTLHTAFVNYGGGQILNISNDHQTTIS